MRVSGIKEKKKKKAIKFQQMSGTCYTKRGKHNKMKTDISFKNVLESHKMRERKKREKTTKKNMGATNDDGTEAKMKCVFR